MVLRIQRRGIYMLCRVDMEAVLKEVCDHARNLMGIPVRYSFILINLLLQIQHLNQEGSHNPRGKDKCWFHRSRIYSEVVQERWKMD